ncbi:maleylpyruvate isomerase family mycothiol-dependent enzyme [Phycicoccus sp. SLBN-51]|uniref:maleylpyruvate isomerase family mycothiol-dependent enzyme n=1 Tax=Phycicoccus sp. SLBN-51 TaxID=2768447 RepID=UPI001152AED4|nr:maleylpyruvate isomerase family mycothiol-dependent enzyme [Phycicoccus sp. SLBN-51]TQJ50583.1 maleylpyruvate isomerase [Phycicoccus sp. SLBN-51]
MTRTLEDSLRWARAGSDLFLTALDGRSDDELARPTALAGWTGKHLTAHVAANADALRNLVHWARTGEETPMYSSTEQRNADIEAGATRPAGELRDWARTGAKALAQDLGSLDQQQWAQTMRTAQGRTVPATEVPWMRAREVMVHAVDLGGAVGFADLPADFLASLIDDITGKRSTDSAATDPHTPALTLTATDTDQSWTLPGGGAAAEVTGPLADVAAYLAGRAPHAVVDADGNPAPPLPRWL